MGLRTLNDIPEPTKDVDVLVLLRQHRRGTLIVPLMISRDALSEEALDPFVMQALRRALEGSEWKAATGDQSGDQPKT